MGIIRLLFLSLVLSEMVVLSHGFYKKRYEIPLTNLLVQLNLALYSF